MPVLAIGGEASFGTMMAAVMRVAANHVDEAIVPDAGHWIMEENPAATIKLVIDFLKQSDKTRPAERVPRGSELGTRAL
jgi:pimeloyl-ACP methyl ester carboxylesterase